MRRRAVRGLPTHSREGSEITARRALPPFFAPLHPRPAHQRVVVQGQTAALNGKAGRDQQQGKRGEVADINAVRSGE
jgi:hypothetical protein